MASKTDITGRVKTKQVPYDEYGHVIQRVRIVLVKGHAHVAWYCSLCAETKNWVQFKTETVGSKKK